MSLLQKGNEIELLTGDLFGLTPDAFWFRIEKSDDEAENTPSNAVNMETNGLVSNETTIPIKVERVSHDESNSVDGEQNFSVDQPIKSEPMDTFEVTADVIHSNGQTSAPQPFIKTEIKTEELETETSSNQNETNIEQIAGSSNPISVAQARNRECCKYGIRCYRYEAK